MKIIFCAVGKMHEPYVKTGVDDFTRRISHYYPVEWKIFPPLRQAGTLTHNELRKGEGEAVLTWLKKDDVLVALDEKGRQMSSEGLAALLSAKANESTRQLIFLIGGAYGLEEALFQRAQFRWSLSQLVFPHQLVRLILAEQVYRACTILRNEKYHHS